MIATIALVTGCAGSNSGVALADVKASEAARVMDSRASEECRGGAPDVPGQSEVLSALNSTLGEAYELAVDFDSSRASRADLDLFGPDTYVALCVFTGAAWSRAEGDYFLLYKSAGQSVHGSRQTLSGLVAYW